jgi:thimet oligopeptidase
MSVAAAFAAPGVNGLAACAKLFPKTLADIADFTAAAKATATRAVDAIVTDTAPPTFASVGRAADLAEAAFGSQMSVLSVNKHVDCAAEMRDAASKAVVDLHAFHIDTFSSNKKLYARFEALEGTAEARALTGQQQYWLTDVLASFRRDGLNLPDAEFAKVSAVKKRLSDLTSTFERNTVEDKTTVEVTAAELAGVPAAIVASLKKAEGGEGEAEGGEARLVLGMDYPTYFGVMRNCEVAATRKAMARAFNRRAFPANEAVLKDVVRARHELATLLGFGSFAELYLQDKMAKAPPTVTTFIDELVPGLQKKWAEEKALLTGGALPASVVLTAGGDIESYDVTYLMHQHKKAHLNVDETGIQEYFTLGATIDAMFAIYERFFNVKFSLVAGAGAALWDAAVQLVEVRGGAGAATVYGHVAMDLLVRDGKYQHACCHGVVPAVRQAGGGHTPSVGAVICNYPPATAERPTLLMHNEATTLFHEFGHAMHGVLGRAEMATHAGTSVKRDFVELPSQLLEQWLWEPSVLDMATKHHATGAPLPAALVAAKVAAKNAFSGHDSLRQLQFATLSLQIFGADFATSDDADATALFQGIAARVTPGIHFDDASRFTCAFGHLMGYGAAYYGYMWSEVFTIDVFDRIRRDDGLMSAAVGQRYVDAILKSGGGRAPDEMLADFLGRPPNNKAFLAMIGIEAN